MSSTGKRQNECSVSCRCRCCLPRHGDPHGPRGGPRGSALHQGGRVEQLLHAAAHAQRMPPVGALLLAPTMSAGESPLRGGGTFLPRGVLSSHLWSPVCQIVNEPPPLWEVPSNCNNFTAKVFRAGLRKDPERRASAAELRRKTTKALRAGQDASVKHIYGNIYL